MKIAVGCGKRNYGLDWFHRDGHPYPHISSDDIYLTDIYQTADLIYASHLIAYFDRDEIKVLLSSWYRALKPGGILRIATPNFDLMSFIYVERNIDLSKILGPLYGKMKMGDKTIYHKTTYDFNSLKNVLTEAGFKNVDLYDHYSTEHAEIDDHSAAYLKGKLISLNVECTK